MEEQTLILVKPDGVSRGHIGEVITRLEDRGFTIEQLKVVHATLEQLKQHYADKLDAPYFGHIVAYMQEGPLVAIVASGTHIVDTFHRMAGKTNPFDAQPGTIRADFGREWPDGQIRNVVHSSDSPEAAQHEINIWFPELCSQRH